MRQPPSRGPCRHRRVVELRRAFPPIADALPFSSADGRIKPGGLTGGQAPTAWGAYAAAPRGVPMGFRIAPPLRYPSPMCAILLRCKRVAKGPPAVQRSACFYHAERLFVTRWPAWPASFQLRKTSLQRFDFDAPTLIFAGEPLDYFSGICHFSPVLSPPYSFAVWLISARRRPVPACRARRRAGALRNTYALAAGDARRYNTAAAKAAQTMKGRYIA